MDALRPYLFWVIMGVVIVLILAAGVLLVPTAQTQAAAESLTRQHRELSDIAERASEDIQSYSTSNPDEFRELRNRYLITEEWEPGLKALQADYQQQKEAIIAALLERSQLLARPVSQASTPGDWFFAYQDATAEWLRSLHEDGLVVLNTRTSGFGGGGAGAGANQDLTQEDYETRADLRGSVGLYTYGTSYPQPALWEPLTIRFRILEMVGSHLRQSQVPPAVNPLVEDHVPSPVPMPVKLLGVTWGTGGYGTGSAPDNPAIPGGEAIELSLRVRGVPSAILALSDRLDGNGRPLVALRGYAWQQTATGISEANPVDVPMEADIHLSVLRFTEPALQQIGN